jgi:gas vesicle protein GvpL/GvpF
MDTSREDHGGTYLYAIARGPLPASFSTQAVANPGAEIRAVRVDDLAAIVSDVATTPVEATRNDVLAHSDALQELLATAPAVVPLRFGTVFPDDAAMRTELLESRAEELHSLLRFVENRVELRVKAFYVEDRVLREIVDQHPRIAALQRRTRSLPEDATYYERIELGELVASALGAARARDAEAIFARLAPLAVDRLAEEEPHEWAVLAASFLVERRAVPDFDAAVGTLADELHERIELRYVGPLPAYSFVEVLLEPVEAGSPWES